MFRCLILVLLSLFVINAQQFNYTQNDIVALNYALTLEHLESTFYTTYLNMFDQNDFNNEGFTGEVYPYFLLIKNHEVSHVNTLTEAIQSLGAAPVPACFYTFPVTNVSTFISVARVLENTGVMAYDGAINTISSRGYRTVAATIATVEARHAAYLNQIENVIPFPQDFDNATLPSDIAMAIAPFIVNCSYTIELPVAIDLDTSSPSPSPPTSNPSPSSASSLSAQSIFLAISLMYCLVYCF